MEKIVRPFTVDYKLDWEYSNSIAKLRQDLDELEKLGATHVQIEVEWDYDSGNLVIYPFCERLETKQECQERLSQKPSGYNQLVSAVLYLHSRADAYPKSSVDQHQKPDTE